MLFLNELYGLVDCGRTDLFSSFHSSNTYTTKVFDAPVNNHATVDYTVAVNQTALGRVGRVVCWIAQRGVLEMPTIFRIDVGIFTSSSSLSLDMGISKAELHLY